MPVLLPVNELEAGMRLADPFVYRNRVMLPCGKKLNGADIDVLVRKYSGIHVKVGHPLLDSVVEFEDDTYERDVAKQAQTRVAQAMIGVEKRLSGRSELSPKDFAGMQEAARGVMRYLAENPVSAALLCKAVEGGSYLAEHTGAVLFLSMSLGNAVKSYIASERKRQTNARDLQPSVAFDLTPLGLGAMFMDVGMFELAGLFEPEHGPLTDEERRKLRDHPLVGAEMLPDSIPPASRMIVRTHHENFDGTGYPNQLPPEKQHVFTRIVRICDSFDAATSTQVYRDAKTPARAIWEMTVGPNRKYYDSVLTKVFAGLIQPFPIGAKLTLEDGRDVVVVKYNRRNPFKPVVVITTDEKGQALPQHKITRDVKLEYRDDLRIASFGEEDLTYIHEIDSVFPDEEEEAGAGEKFESLFAASYP